MNAADRLKRRKRVLDIIFWVTISICLGYLVCQMCRERQCKSKMESQGYYSGHLVSISLWKADCAGLEYPPKWK